MRTAQEIGTDVAVVGAGIIGAACAWRLVEAGLRVVVVERETGPAQGSTGRSVAGVRQQFADPVNVRLSMLSIGEYRAMPQADYRPVGYLLLAPGEQWDAQRDAAAMQRALGAPVHTLTPAQAAEIVPFAPQGIAGATWCATDGIVDPHGICTEYLARARALGARTLFGAPVRAIEPAAGGWRLEAGDTRVQARVVVNAAGAWSGELAALAGLAVPVTPARRIVFATGPAAEPLRRPLPLTVDLASGVYFRGEGARVIFGRSNPADRGFAQGIDWPWLEQTLEPALARFPWFAGLALDRRACWWGYYELTPDGNPVIGRLPGVEGWVNACGFSGHGVQHAAAVGRLVRAEVDGSASPLDFDSLRIERFAAATSGERLVI